MANKFNIFPINPLPSLQIAEQFIYRVPSEDHDNFEQVSYLGTPVYSNLIFEANSDNPSQSPSNKLGNRGNMPDGSLRIDTVLMTVTQSKNIIATPVAGRNGTIKEYIALGDFDIQIQGAIVSPNPLVFPTNDVKSLLGFLQLNQALPVTSLFLSFFNITYIVVKDFMVGEKMGSRNEVPFQIYAVSDLDGSIDSTGLSWTSK